MQRQYIVKIIGNVSDWLSYAGGALIKVADSAGSTVDSIMSRSFCICENKDADQPRGNREADHAFVFATRIVQSLYFLYLKFQASSHLQWLYILGCV